MSFRTCRPFARRCTFDTFARGRAFPSRSARRRRRWIPTRTEEWAAPVLVRIPELIPPSVPLLTPPTIDAKAMVLVGAVSLCAAVALAAWPFVRTRASASPAPRGNASVARSVVFRSLVVTQVALAMALVALAALLQQSLDTVHGQDAGFVIDRVLVGNLTLAGPAYANPEQITAAERRLASNLARIPGARAVAFSCDHPLEANWIDSFTLAGSAGVSDDVRGSAELGIVSPSYFDTMGVAVIDGRALSEQDDLGAPGAMVVNEAFARSVVDGPVLNRALRSGTPRFNWNDPRVPSEFRIVGIVEDERFKGLEQPSEPAVYMSTRQFPQQQLAMLIRTNVKPAALTTAARDMVRAFDPGVLVANLSPLSSILRRSSGVAASQGSCSPFSRFGRRRFDKSSAGGRRRSRLHAAEQE